MPRRLQRGQSRQSVGQGPLRRASSVERQRGGHPFPDRDAEDLARRIVEEPDQPCLPAAASEAEFSEVRVEDLQRSGLRLVASQQQVRPSTCSVERPPKRTQCRPPVGLQRQIAQPVQPLHYLASLL